MKVSADDPRSIRTRCLLREAFIKLAVKNKVTSLTVLDLTKTAGLNRSTFYLHYAGMHELLEDCARTLFEELRGDINVNQNTVLKQDPAFIQPFAEIVLLHLARYEDFYRTMLGKQGDPLFQDLFQELLSELMFAPLLDRNDKADRYTKFEMYRSFFTAGFAGLAFWWLKNGKPISVEDAALVITRDLLPDYLKLMGD